MAKRGFFAELQHQQQVAVRRREQEAKAAAREHAAAVRRAEQARRQAETAARQAERAATADQKRAAAEAKRLHLEAQTAEVEALNSKLASDLADIDSLLEWTLDVDDFVELESLRVVVEHPPFDAKGLDQPLPPPPPVYSPPEPQWIEPPAPSGLGGMLGGKKRHAEERAQAWAGFSAAHAQWQAAVAQVPTIQFQQMQAHQDAERQRQAALAEARARYDAECSARQGHADETNKALDEVINGLAVGAEQAVQEYVSIVLGNSVYPDSFPVRHEFEFDSELHELELRVTVPGPDEVPTVKAYKYAKATDEITATHLPAKAQKDRYASAVHQTAVRSIHEIFEADRQGVVQTISMTLGADTIDPATGQPRHTPLVAVAVDRDSFMAFDLAQVVPQATLQHLGALVSKNPHGLIAVDTSKGIRGR